MRNWFDVIYDFFFKRIQKWMKASKNKRNSKHQVYKIIKE